MYLKKSEPILLMGSGGGIPPEPPFRPPRQKAEAERQKLPKNRKKCRLELYPRTKILVWGFILARSGPFFILFSLLDFNLFVIIILKVEIVNITITYYQIIENMARENNIGENIKKYRTKQGLSQEDFAKKSGVKYTNLN